MKHFVKKFKFELPFNDENALKEAVLHIKSDDIMQISLSAMKEKKVKARINIENKYWIDAFSQNLNSQDFLMPLPDITLVYLNYAYYSNYNFKELKIEEKFKNDIENLTSDYTMNESIIGSIYSFVGYKSTMITLLFTSLESFFNQFINTAIDTKILIGNKEYKIDYYLKFNEKIKHIIPHLTAQKYDLSNNILCQLNALRNDIIHLKYGEKGFTNSVLIDKIINFDFEKNYNEVVKYFNFYKPDYVQICDCKVDY
jgi:hypothetical protein